MPNGIVGYSQVLQSLQAREGFLGHRLDLVSKQSSAVSRHAGRDNRVGKERERESTQLVEQNLIREGDCGIGNPNCVEIRRRARNQGPAQLFKAYFYLY